MHHWCAPSDGVVVASSSDSNSNNRVVFDQPIHDVTQDYPEPTLRSGWRCRTWDGSIAGLECGGDGGDNALFIANNGEGVDYSPVVFLARLPGGVHLSQLPDPRSICNVVTINCVISWVKTGKWWGIVDHSAGPPQITICDIQEPEYESEDSFSISCSV